MTGAEWNLQQLFFSNRIFRSAPASGSCKPNSVLANRRLKCESAHLSGEGEYTPNPPAKRDATHPKPCGRAAQASYAVLHRIGFTLPWPIARHAVGSYPAFSPLPLRAVCFLWHCPWTSLAARPPPFQTESRSAVSGLSSLKRTFRERTLAPRQN